MKGNRKRNTRPELALRRLVFGMGYRYRLHVHSLPGTPDIVFARRRKIIFVHGCFWHGHELESCLDGRRPKSNTGYWNPKLTRNKERDAERVASLSSAGWKVLTVWECEVKDVRKLIGRLKRFLR